MKDAGYAAYLLRTFAYVAALIPACSYITHADPIGPYDLFGEPLPLAVILVTCFLSFFLEYLMLRRMLKGCHAATHAQFRRAFIKANAISFPIAWAIYFSMGLLWPPSFILGIVLAEVFAIVSERLLYNRWIDLRRTGKRGWQAVIAANLVSWIAGIVVGVILHSGRSLSCRSAANPICIIGAPKISIKTCKSEIKYHPLR